MKFGKNLRYLNKDYFMNNYELTYIVDSNVEKEELKVVYEEILELIKKNNGKIGNYKKIADFEIANEELEEKTSRNYLNQKNTEETPFIKKKLAYPIGKAKNTYYGVINFELEPSKIANLEDKLRFKEKILRYLIIKKEVKRATKPSLTSVGMKAEKSEKKELIKKPKKSLESISEIKLEDEAKLKTKGKGKKEKIKLEDIQEKLDKILDI